MGRYILNRVLIAVPVLIGITILNFAFLHLAPGDPVTMMMPTDPTVGAGSMAQTHEWQQYQRERLGLDKPVPVQYVLWLRELAEGNFGRSIASGYSVLPEVAHRLGSTLELTLTALAISIIMGIGIGVVSAVSQYSVLDYLATFCSFLAVSVPGFFLALLFIYLFALKLHVLPTSGMSTLGGSATLSDALLHLIMPAAVLAASGTASLMRFTRSSMLEVLRQDYVVTARSKGLSERLIVVRHAFRNGLLPIITVVSLQLPGLFGGSVIIEQVFYWQGMGMLGIKAVFDRDYPVIMALNLISAVLVLSANLLADIAYAFADPRIRYARTLR